MGDCLFWTPSEAPVQYWITKECGGWWGEMPDTSTKAWGVSDAQRRLAKRVEPSDILLHYIDSVRAWAGYSTVTGRLEANNRDSDKDWRDAIPSVIPIQAEVWLTMHQCEITKENPDLHSMKYHRKNAFTSIPANVAELIVEAIEAAKNKQCIATAEFQKSLEIDAENYYWTIVRSRSKGRCWLCGETAASWIARQSKFLPIQESVAKEIGEKFLDMAHIAARHKKGRMSPDNIRALCPNCHRIVDRIPDEARKLLLSAMETSEQLEIHGPA